MKRKLSLFLIILIAMLTACKTKQEGEPFYITLNSYDNDNYEWTYYIEDEQVVKTDTPSYTKTSKVLGGEHIFKIVPLKEGQTTIHFEYKIKGDEDSIFDYSIKATVNNDLSLNIESTSGSYVAFLKIIDIDKEKLGLEKELYDYKVYFSDDVKNINDDECDWLVVYDKNEIVAAFAIANNSNNIYKLVNENYVLIN